MAFALVALWPVMAHADSRFETGASTPSRASAHLDFTIIVPNVAFLRLGTGPAAPGATQVLSVTTVNAPGTSAKGKDLPDTVISARVVGNAGNLSLGADAQGRGFSRLLVAAGAGSTSHTIAHPALVDNAGTAKVLPVTRGRVTEMDANWTFRLTPAAHRRGTQQPPTPIAPNRVIYSLSMP